MGQQATLKFDYHVGTDAKIRPKPPNLLAVGSMRWVTGIIEVAAYGQQMHGRF
jgi:hypothetical protein